MSEKERQLFFKDIFRSSFFPTATKISMKVNVEHAILTKIQSFNGKKIKSSYTLAFLGPIIS